MAVRQNKTAVVKALLLLGAWREAKSRRGETAEELALRRGVDVNFLGIEQTGIENNPKQVEHHQHLVETTNRRSLVMVFSFISGFLFAVSRFRASGPTILMSILIPVTGIVSLFVSFCPIILSTVSVHVQDQKKPFHQPDTSQVPTALGRI